MHAPPARDRQGSGALRTVGLVRGQRHEIDAERAEIERALADALRRVDVQPRRVPDACTSAAIAAMSWMTPISLFTCMSDTSTVSGVSAAATCAGSMRPSRPGAR